MTKKKLCVTRQVDAVRTSFSTLVGGLCLLTVVSHLPVAFAQTDDGYLKHLWSTETLDNQLLKPLNGNQNFAGFCAIAYSDSTGQWSYAWGKQTQADAEQAAKAQCGEPDAEILTWSDGSWYCALAQGPDSYGADCGETAQIAEDKALAVANENGSGNKIILLVGGNPPIVQLNNGTAAPTSNQSAASAPVAPGTGLFWPVETPRH
jgi:hypothetical protein